jgi:hypothetical protein
MAGSLTSGELVSCPSEIIVLAIAGFHAAVRAAKTDKNRSAEQRRCRHRYDKHRALMRYLLDPEVDLSNAAPDQLCADCFAAAC